MFDNLVEVEWPKDEPRKMRLLKTLTFTDGAGKVWEAPAGAKIDGASIPKLLWSLIGSPFVGKYRRATVFHDIYCQTRSEPHRKVHDMFLEAMLADGVSVSKAKMMHDAVINYGPRWDKDGNLIDKDDIYQDEDDDLYL
ncbi:MAG: DUF1353 domain-containing protein, partial [Thermodesulfobacteriota bacterium]